MSTVHSRPHVASQIKFLGLAAVLAVLLITGNAQAGTVSAAALAPTVDGADIANLLGGTDIGGDQGHLWNNRPVQGQTFLTGGNPYGYLLRSITLQNLSNSVNTGTITARVGTVAGNMFSLLRSESMGNVSIVPGNYVTATYGQPITLLPNQLHGFDWGVSGSGFITSNSAANPYPAGQAYSSGANSVPNDASLTFHAAADRVFHLDLQPLTRTISVNINGWNGNPMSSVSNVTGVAGVVPVGNWNNHGAVAGTSSGDAGGATTGRDGSVGGLIDHLGGNTDATYTWKFANYWGNTTGSTTTQNNTLFRGYADTTGAGGNDTGIQTMQVSDLPSEFTDHGYSVYVYLGGDSNHAGAIQITGTDDLGNTMSKFLIQNSDSLRAGDSFLESVALTAGAATNGNYVVLSGFFGALIDLSFNDLTGGRARPVGFQIVANAAPVPEPSTLLMAGLGALLVLSRVRRLTHRKISATA